MRVPLIVVTGKLSRLGISRTLTALDSLFVREMNVLFGHRQRDAGISSFCQLDEVVATIGRFAAPVIALPRSRPGTATNLGDIFGNSPKR